MSTQPIGTHVHHVSATAKFLLQIDDTLDLFAEHAIGGVIGLIFNGFFASQTIISLDEVNTSIVGGWVDHNWKQLYIQVGYVASVCGYTFVVTAILAKAVDLVPGLHLRTTPEGEALGLDEVEVSETCFQLNCLLMTRESSDRRVCERLH